MQEKSSAQLSRLPSVSRLLNEARTGELISKYGVEDVTAAIRGTLEQRREAIKFGRSVDIGADS